MSQVPAQTSEKLEVKETATKVETTEKDEIETTSEAPEVNEEPVVGQQVPMAFNIIQAPKVCPPGYRLDAKGNCRKIM